MCIRDSDVSPRGHLVLDQALYLLLLYRTFAFGKVDDCLERVVSSWQEELVLQVLLLVLHT